MKPIRLNHGHYGQITDREDHIQVNVSAIAIDKRENGTFLPLIISVWGAHEQVKALKTAVQFGVKLFYQTENQNMYAPFSCPSKTYQPIAWERLENNDLDHMVIAHRCWNGSDIYEDTLYVNVRGTTTAEAIDEVMGIVPRFTPSPIFPEWRTVIAESAKLEGLFDRVDMQFGTNIWRVKMDMEKWAAIAAAALSSGAVQSIRSLRQKYG